MSQLAAPTRAPRRVSAPRSRPRSAARPVRSASRPLGASPVTSVAATTRTRDSRFMGLVIVVAIASALALLFLNTMRAEQSFTLSTLRSDVSTLNDRQQALESEISAVSAPEQLAMKAEAAGMGPASQITYVKRDTGKTIGVAGRAKGGAALSVNTLPTTPSSRAAAEALASGTIGLHVTDPVATAKAAAKADAAKKAADAKAAASKKTSEGKKASK